MSVVIKGGCRCRAVRYTLPLDAFPRTYACHCLDCQTCSGSALSQQAIVPEEALAARGPLVPYEVVRPIGRISNQRICGSCNARIFDTNSAWPGMAVLRAGTLDHSDELSVVAIRGCAESSAGSCCRREWRHGPRTRNPRRSPGHWLDAAGPPPIGLTHLAEAGLLRNSATCPSIG